MTAPGPRVVQFRVHGQRDDGPGEPRRVRLSAARAPAEVHLLQARPGRDAVALQLLDGPRLVLHPENARELFASQAGAEDGTVPARLSWTHLEAAAGTRGDGGGAAVLTSIEVLGDIARQRAASLLAAEVTRRVDGQVAEGLYRLDPDALPALKGSGRRVRRLPASDRPQLVLVHGAFVDTARTFRALWRDHPEAVQALAAAYPAAMWALDHATLGASPVANALTLARALPDGTRLHLLTHSRGGLVAEVLARACADEAEDDRAIDRLFDARHEALAGELRRLRHEVRGRGLRVERIVRVACPARGTLLASRRLDAWLSVLQWLLARAGVPVLPALVDFLHEVARRRAEPQELPGLEALMPDSPLLAWLREAPQPLRDDLRVVAGDLEGDSLAAWLKTLLADAFYWTDNDLAVQTRSMYGGAPRHPETPARFFLDRGGDVDHFRYFSRPRTLQAVTQGLLADEPDGFATIGPLSWAGADSGGARVPVATGPQPARPAVVLLPGLLGSHLSVDGERVWIGWRLVGGLHRLAWDRAVEPEALVESSYDALAAHLADTHEVIRFPYDWRAPLDGEAARLAACLDAACDARAATGQPVRLLAHSMGGLLAQAVAMAAPATWARVFAHPQARLLMLGTPLAGSWAPMQALSGDDPFANAVLALGGGLLHQHRARQVLAGMPGPMHLQAGLLDPALGLDRESTWRALATQDLATVTETNRWHRDEAQLAPYRWGIPPQAVLDEAVAWQRRLRDHLAATPPRAACVVIGEDRPTPAGFRLDPRFGLEYLDAPGGGDGRVGWDSALRWGAPAWRAPVSHGRLPADPALFDAYLDLLAEGRTDRLPVHAAPPGPASGSAAPSVRRPSRDGRAGSVPASGLQALVEPPAALPSDTPSAPALSMGVLNADLRALRGPLMLGHYRAERLTGTEAAMDTLLGGTMSGAMRAGLYPGEAGTHQVFERPADGTLGPSAVIVVGLGDEGRLGTVELQGAVRQAVLATAQREAERGGGTSFPLAATLIGSGGSGIGAGAAAQAVAMGVSEANAALLETGWPLVSRLVFVEMYLDRATEAWSALDVLRQGAPGAWSLDPVVDSGEGALRRPLDSGYRGVGYDLVTAVGDERVPGRIEYTLDTRRARAEVRGQATQAGLVRDLVAAASDDRRARPGLGTALFQLLVPRSLEPFLAGSGDTVLELDRRTAALPWELLDTSPGGVATGGGLPWSIRSRLLRKLRTERFRLQPLDAGEEGGVLVVGEPVCDVPGCAPLPGARAEAQAVAARLGVPALVGATAVEVIDALMGAGHRLVHLAGHGRLADDEPGSGLLLSGGHVLGAREIESLRTVPELVFVNACHLGRIDPRDEPLAGRRPAFAAQMAEQLIRIGVRCVVAAGWAVDDEPARVFALRFYDALLRGDRFMDAVAQARQVTWSTFPDSLTWAAYQCYGDPDWMWQAPQAHGDGPSEAHADQAAEPPGTLVSAPSLALALETLAVQAAAPCAALDALRARLQRMEQRHAPRWGEVGAVAEAFGVAHEALGAADAALAWFRRAADAADGSASIRVLRRLGER